MRGRYVLGEDAFDKAGTRDDLVTIAPAIDAFTSMYSPKLAMETSHRAAVPCFNIVGIARSLPARCYCYA